MNKLAVVVFNLGGPDSPDAVRPFLFNLFNDAAIIGVPQPVRWLLAQVISRRRAPAAREIYGHLGGKSPLLEFTRAQAAALQNALSADGGGEARVFVCMRYWRPASAETAAAVKSYAPDEIVLLPLYPQFSTTTSGSSLADWRRAAGRAGLDAPTRRICCYPDDKGWIGAQAALLAAAVARAGPKARVLFSAHGLPRKIVAGGDPYQWQVEQTAAAVIDRLGGHPDWTVCYQSRVGPLEWIGPATEDQLIRAAADGVGVIVVPIAFVSEHSETLVELDIEYRAMAAKLGIGTYERVPAVGVHPSFINGLADRVRAARGGGDGGGPFGGREGARMCPAAFGKCPCAAEPGR